MHAWPPGHPPLMGNSAPMYSFFLPADGRGQRRRTMRDARRNTVCPRGARAGLVLLTSMVQGELNRSDLAPVLQRSQVGQRLAASVRVFNSNVGEFNTCLAPSNKTRVARLGLTRSFCRYGVKSLFPFNCRCLRTRVNVLTSVQLSVMRVSLCVACWIFSGQSQTQFIRHHVIVTLSQVSNEPRPCSFTHFYAFTHICD